MIRIKNLQSIVTEESITLFWEKTMYLESNQYYTIYCDNRKVSTTKKTHFTLKGLKCETLYSVFIQLMEKNLNGRESVLENTEVQMLMTKIRKKRIDITDKKYNAKGDGETLNTIAIQKAIDDCGKDEVVYIPMGVFLTGALRLHSDMELYLAEGAVLQGTSEIKDYLPLIPSRFEGIERQCYSSVLNLGYMDHEADFNCENVVIHGKGTICSGGMSLAKKIIEDEKEKQKDYILSLGDRIANYENENTIPGRIRPRLINISNCRNVRITGLDLKDGASWNVHMIYSDHIITNHCKFYSKGVWNGDGWDPDSSTNCTIFDCVFYTGDDSIAIKSGKNPEGNKIARPSKHIRIFDCSSMVGHGISIGSEISGGIEDVHIWDCDMKCAKVGIEIKATKKRGGYVKNIQVENCSTPRLLFHSVGYNDDGEGAEYPPIFEDCRFDHIHILGEYKENEKTYQECEAIEICGFDEPGYKVHNISFSNLKIESRKSGKLQKMLLKNCRNVTFENIDIG